MGKKGERVCFAEIKDRVLGQVGMMLDERIPRPVQGVSQQNAIQMHQLMEQLTIKDTQHGELGNMFQQRFAALEGEFRSRIEESEKQARKAQSDAANTVAQTIAQAEAERDHLGRRSR